MVIKMIRKKFCFFLFIFALISITTLYFTRSILPSNLDNIYIKQIVLYLIGFMMFFLIKSNNLLFKYITIAYVFSCILLFSLLLFTVPINNAKCWFIIPYIGTIQPSEFVKIFLIILIANILVKEKKLKLIKIMFIFLVPAVLTYLEPDTGLVIIYMIGTLSIIFCYFKKSRKFLFAFFIFIVIGISFLFLYQNQQDFFLKVFGKSLFLRIDRIINWQKQDGYQLNNALIAIGSRKINFSVDIINTYFPESHTDFIFAALAASFGYFFTIIFLVITLYFDFFLLKIARKEKNKTNKLIIIGFTSMIIYQQIQNIGMNIGLLPITGITLPFISYGGSSLLSNILMLTIIKNFKKKDKKSFFKRRIHLINSQHILRYH